LRSFLREVAQQFPQLAEIAQNGRARQRNAESPEFQEVADPLGIVQEISEVAVAVPHLAVGQVYPGSSLTEFVDSKLMGRGDHGNEIKLLDSLQGGMYPLK
jgi:hypothetical protein